MVKTRRSGLCAPILDPDRWTKRHTAVVGLTVIVAAIAAVLGDHGGSAAHGVRTFAGAALGCGLIMLAASLPGVSVLGLYLGASVTTAAILSWTHPDKPRYVWAVQGAEIVVLSIWSAPLVRQAWLPRLLPRLGTVWTGVSYWVLGIAGAVLTGLALSNRRYFTVGAQRVAYLVLVTVTVLAVIKGSRSPRRSVTIGLTAAFLVTLGVLFILGSSNVFESVHAAPNNSAARYLENRFWGGAGVFYHPVSLAGIAVAVAMRVALDPLFRMWQRVAVTAVAPLVIVLTQTRTAAILVVACVLVAVAFRLAQKRRGHARARALSHRGITVAVAVAVVFVAGASILLRARIGSFFLVERYEDAPLAQSYGRADDVTSGRVATWKEVFREFRTDGWTEKLFGSAERSRATVLRPGDDPKDPVTVLTDNAAIGALRRGGLLGVVAFVVGLILLVRNALRSNSWWFGVAAIATLVTIPTTDWLLGSPLWYLLLAAEVSALVPIGEPDGSPPPTGGDMLPEEGTCDVR